MPATGDPQPLAPQLGYLELAELLQLKVAGELFPCSFIHEVSPYSADPEDLVRDRDPAPGTHGNGRKWFFCSAPNFHQSTGGAPRRNRQVGGGQHQQRRFWHPEGGTHPIGGPDGKPVAVGARAYYWRALSYVLKVKNPPGEATPFRNERLGWCMIEVGLVKQEAPAGQHWEICKVYRSPLPPGVPAVVPMHASGVEDSANQSTILTSSTDIVLKSNITMLEIENTSMLSQSAFIFQTLSIFEDLGISVDCMTTSQGNMSFALVPSHHLSQKLINLAIDNAIEDLQKFAVVHPLEGGSIISLTGSAGMSPFTLERALGVLRRINVNVQKSLQDSSKVAHVSLVVLVPDSVAQDCVQALRSEFHDKSFVPQVVHGSEDLGVSSSGFKRKAVCEGVRPERGEITDPSSSVVVQTAFTGNDPIPAMVAGVVQDEEYQSWIREDEDDGVQGLAGTTDTNSTTLADFYTQLFDNDYRYPFGTMGSPEMRSFF